MNQDYYIGLDIGTNSVGWAVTDVHYNLIKAPVRGKYKNHDMWGIRLFESGNTAAERRMARSNRRRGQRKVQRIKMLQDLFAAEMEKVDPTFFIRLNESRLHPDDKSEFLNLEKHPLFTEGIYDESEYYKKYPTIYHLRKELIDNKETHDIRLVYLALHHIIKNRGHFLREGSFADAVNFDEPFNCLIASFGDMGVEIIFEDREQVKQILSNNSLGNSTKQKLLSEQFKIRLQNSNQEDLSDKELEKKLKLMVTEITKLMAGNKGAINKIFQNIPAEIDGTKTDAKFSEEKYETELKPMIEVQYPDETACIDHIKELYDWSVMQEILPSETKYISDAKIDAYDRHQKNLKILKNQVFKVYFSDEDYRNFFKRNASCNYVSYIGFMKRNGKKVSVKKCSEDAFYSSLKKILDKAKKKAEENADHVFESIYAQVENHTLLPLQRSKDNGVIPKQVHEYELDAILNNAANYLPFLNDIDEGATSVEDKSVKGKIKSIFNYRIPYYVGPLSTRHKKETNGRQTGANVWIVRKEGMENEYIYPWNFNEVVDKEKCNKVFIERMTNKCTYLIGEDVLPKNSLLYKKYMVLNELNNVKVYGKEIPVSLKQDIYNNLFKKKAKVTGKNLLDYLQRVMNDTLLTLEDLSGFDKEKDFSNNLSSYLDFKKKVFHDKELTFEQENVAETIIKWITIYGDDSRMIGNMVKRYYGDMFSKDQIAQIKRLRYSGWGNFSEKFLVDIYGMVGDEQGNSWSIIEGMWNTNENLMQLLSNKYKFIEEIDKINSQDDFDADDKSYENLISGLYVSPANKRSIWQTIQIVEEIQKIMKHPAKKIFVEMAKGEDKIKKRTTSRKQKLIDLYNECDADVREWAMEEIESRDEREFNSNKLFLYYLQQGKCAYTGHPINLADLMAGSSRWDRDHIYPQSKIKDDSLDNLVLVERDKNAKKDNGLISREIQQNMEQTWKYWYDKGFMTKEKLDRLLRREDFTDDELSGFIARQLVETRQTTKVVADVMKRIYANNGTEIVYVKAGLVSDFRKYPLGVLKSRRVNDYHHAKDAYLNIVVGNVYNSKYTNNPWKWMKENREKIDSGKISFNKTMCFDVVDSNGEMVWKGCDKFHGEDGKSHFIKAEDPELKGNMIVVGGDIDRVRKIVRQDNCMYTEYTYCQNGMLYNATHERNGSKSATVPLKKDLPIEKYGGYKTAATSYFAEVEFDGKKGERVKNIIGMPIYVSNMLEHNPSAFIEYCENKGMKNVSVLYPMIKKNSLLIANGFPMRIRGESSPNIILKGNLQLRISVDKQECIRKIEKAIEKHTKNIDDIHDGIKNEELIDLYDEYIKKLQVGVYSNRPANMKDVLSNGRETFINLSIEDKCYLLDEILTMLRCDIKTNSNLELIEYKTNAGDIKKNTNVLCKNSLVLVNQSVTGLYENRVNLS